MTITRNFSVLANGAGSANNLSLGGATLGTNALAVTGTTDISSTINFGGFAAEGTVVAAATTNLGTSTANRQSVTGSTTITSFATAANSYRILRFTGAPLLTYNATSLITPTGANIQAAAGDVATLTSDGSGNWRIISYAPYGGVVDSFATSVTVNDSAATNVTSISLTPGKWRVSATMIYNSNNVGNGIACSISGTSGTLGSNLGKNNLQGAISGNPVGSAVIPALDVTPGSTTTYYLVSAVFGTPGSAVCNGYIRAERIY